MKKRAQLLNSFIRYMAQNESASIPVLLQRYDYVPEETLMKFLRWMEAGNFLEIHGNTTIIWKGGYQFSSTEPSWAFHSFNG